MNEVGVRVKKRTLHKSIGTKINRSETNIFQKENFESIHFYESYRGK